MSELAVRQEQQTAIAPGFYEAMPFDEYAAAPGLNGSKIVNMRRSAMHYRHTMLNPSPETDATRMGTLVHRMILEPSLIENIAVWGRPEEQKVRRGKVWEAFKADHADMLILTTAESEASTGMARAALSQAPIRKWVSEDGPTELSMFWEQPHTGRQFKARIDKLIPDLHTVVDLKTTRDSRPFRFGPQAYQLGYVIKMAHYWDGYRTLLGSEPSIKLLALESKAPHESVVYDVPRDLIMLGLEERDQLIHKIEDCKKQGEWPAAELEEVTLQLPAWANLEPDTELELEA